MPKIFDCFTFFNEEDVLRIRLEELEPVVDTFVIVQGDKTFRGQPKQSGIDWSWKWLDPFREKIQPFIVELPKDASAWDREIYQRNHIKWCLKHLGAQPYDIVLISDVDEIPRRSEVKPVYEEYRFILDKYTYGLNMLTDEGNTVARILPFDDIGNRTIEEVRRGWNGKPIHDGGWEFSSLGTAEDILVKLKSFSHSEFDTPDLTLEVLRERMSRYQDIVGRDMYHKVVEIDDTWPEAVKNNREYWSRYEW